MCGQNPTALTTILQQYWLSLTSRRKILLEKFSNSQIKPKLVTLRKQ